MPDVRPEGFSPHRSLTGIIHISPFSGFLGPFSYFIFQYSAVLHWLEPTSAYLEVSHADAG